MKCIVNKYILVRLKVWLVDISIPIRIPGPARYVSRDAGPRTPISVLTPTHWDSVLGLCSSLASDQNGDFFLHAKSLL